MLGMCINVKQSLLLSWTCRPRTSIVDVELVLTHFDFHLKRHSQLCDLADLDTSFASLKSVYLNPKSNVCVGYI